MPLKNKRTLWLPLLAAGLVGLVMTSSAGAYPWPLAPMDVQHNISATFCECRQERDHFHDAVDIPLGYGGAVLAMAGGTVLGLDPSGANAWIRVGRYAYVHVDPNPDLDVGETVIQGEVVGTTNEQGHIHFKDGGGASGTTIINPLRPGGLFPFQDPYLPTVQTIKFYQNGTTHTFPTAKVSGLVDIISRSYDQTDPSTWGGNNGVYSIGWQVFADDGTTSVEGPNFPYTFDEKPSDSYIKNVYFTGSNTSTYYYIVTNQISHDDWWDTRLVEPGNYKVAVYCCDTRNNWDTTAVWAEVAEQDVTPPDIPALTSALGTSDNKLTVAWRASQDEDLKGYRLYHSYEGIDWFNNHDEDDLPPTATQLLTGYFQNDQAIFFKLTAVDSAAMPNESGTSDTYGTRLTDTGPKVLVVDGFDRTSGSWVQSSHPFALSHARALDDHDVAFDCCANEALLDGPLQLDDYDAVIWILGDEGVDDSTFTPMEQSLVKAYLEGGGSLFLSGSGVGCDLADSGSTDDQLFFHHVLHADYVADSAGVNAVEGLSGTIFEGLTFAFDDGTHGIYAERHPNAIAPREGSVLNLTYSGTSFGAGLQYQGTFGSGSQEGQLVYLGFPFETIYPESLRTEVMARVLGFFDIITDAGQQEIVTPLLPREFMLYQSYPNPFNPTTAISFALPGDGPQRATLRIYNALGQRVRTLVDELLEPGHHTVIWDGRDDRTQPVGSGVYFYTLRAGPFVGTKKMVLLK